MTDFEKHYSDLFDYVYRYVYVRLKDKDTAEDLVSKIFLSAFEKQKQYDETKGSWRQWITGIARNTIFQHWKSQKQMVELDDLALTEVNLHIHQSQKAAQDQKLEFQKVMDSVSPQLRILLILRYEEDLNYEDIAEILNKTPAAVRKTYSRLHEQLSAQFKDFND